MRPLKSSVRTAFSDFILADRSDFSHSGEANEAHPFYGCGPRFNPCAHEALDPKFTSKENRMRFTDYDEAYDDTENKGIRHPRMKGVTQ